METEITFLKIYSGAYPLSAGNNVPIAQGGTALFQYIASVDYSDKENTAVKCRNGQYL